MKRHDGMIIAAGIESRQTCRACGASIEVDYATPIGHAYADGTHWFHSSCHALWDDERSLGMPPIQVRDDVAPYTWPEHRSFSPSPRDAVR